MRPLFANEIIALYDQRHQLIVESLHKQLGDLEKTKQATPHPLDFSMADDPNAYQNACSAVQCHNYQIDKAITTHENFVRLIERLDREMEAKLNPANEYSI